MGIVDSFIDYEKRQLVDLGLQSAVDSGQAGWRRMKNGIVDGCKEIRNEARNAVRGPRSESEQFKHEVKKESTSLGRKWTNLRKGTETEFSLGQKISAFGRMLACAVATGFYGLSILFDADQAKEFKLDTLEFLTRANWIVVSGNKTDAVQSAVSSLFEKA